MRTQGLSTAGDNASGFNYLSEYSMALGQDRLTISGLTDIAAHSSTEKVNVVALTTLRDKAHKIAIFYAVYDSEP